MPIRIVVIGICTPVLYLAGFVVGTACYWMEFFDAPPPQPDAPPPQPDDLIPINRRAVDRMIEMIERQM